MNDLRITVDRADTPIPIVDLAGKFLGTGEPSSASEEAFSREITNLLLNERRFRGLIVNLTNLTSIDSAGVGDILAASKMVARKGMGFKIIVDPLQQHLMGMLNRMHLDTVLSIHGNVKDALASFD